jgi:hypothetical protein
MINYETKLKELSKMKVYNQRKEQQLSDMATAYLATEYKTLDESLKATRTIRKVLRSLAFTNDEINDYLIQHSYVNKDMIKKFYNLSLYGEDGEIKKDIEKVIAHHTDKTTTDIIIDAIKSRPQLLSALQRGVSKSGLTERYNISSPVLLQNFYAKHKDIIND